MRVLVTGGTGFVGSHIVERLVAYGHDVVVAKRVTSNLQWLPIDKIELIDAPMSDLDPLVKILPEIDAVVHVAGITRARRKSDFYRTNLLATVRLAELCASRCNALRRFVFISSQAAGCPGKECDGVCESTQESPISAYGKSKLEAEHMLEKFSSIFPITVLRPPTVYGPRDRDVLFFFRLIKAGFIVFSGSPERQFSAVYAKDLANAVAMVLTDSEHDFARYFITDGETHTWRELARTIVRNLDNKTITIRLPRAAFWPAAALSEFAMLFTKNPPLLTFEKAGEISKNWVCDGSLAENELGFLPEFPLENGIARTANWYREHGWI